MSDEPDSYAVAVYSDVVREAAVDVVSYLEAKFAGADKDTRAGIIAATLATVSQVCDGHRMDGPIQPVSPEGVSGRLIRTVNLWPNK